MKKLFLRGAFSLAALYLLLFLCLQFILVTTFDKYEPLLGKKIYMYLEERVVKPEPSSDLPSFAKASRFQVDYKYAYPVFSWTEGFGVSFPEIIIEGTSEIRALENDSKKIPSDLPKKRVCLTLEGLTVYPSIFQGTLKSLFLDHFYFLDTPILSEEKNLAHFKQESTENLTLNSAADPRKSDLLESHDDQDIYLHLSSLNYYHLSTYCSGSVEKIITPQALWSLGQSKEFKIEEMTNSISGENSENSKKFQVSLPSIFINEDEVSFYPFSFYINDTQLWWPQTQIFDMFESKFQAHLNYNFDKNSLSASLKAPVLKTNKIYLFDDILDTELNFSINILGEEKNNHFDLKADCYLKGGQGKFEVFNPYLLKKNVNIFKKVFASKKKNTDNIFQYDKMNAHLHYENDRVNIVKMNFSKGQSSLDIHGHYLPLTEKYKLKFYFSEKRIDNPLSFGVVGQGENYSLTFNLEDIINTVPELISPLIDTIAPLFKKK